MTEKSDDAARILGDAAARRERIEELPAHLRPVDLDEAYRVQSALIGQSKEDILGFKIAATSRAGQAHIGIDHPISGQLVSSQVVMLGDTADMHGNLMQAAEAEFVFEFTSAVMPRAEPYSWQEVMTYVGHLRFGIEIPDSRYRNFNSVGATQLIADNACAYLFVLGPRVQAEWRGDDLSRRPARLLMDGEEATRGSGADALGDPRFALAWLVNHLSGRGLGIQPGQFVTTGVCGDPADLDGARQVVADFGDYGSVEIGLSYSDEARN